MALSDFHSTYLTVEQRDDVVVAQFQVPQLTDELNIEEMATELFSLADHYGFRKVVVDLSKVDFVTSSVLGKLITLHRRLHRNGGKLAICSLRPSLDEVMRTSRLIEFFNVVGDVPTGVELVSQTPGEANA
jgi:anti-anti-sigma factor